MLQGLGEKVLIFDGGMGTLIQEANVSSGLIPEELNITHKEIIQRIHASYQKAGANFLTTNTFGANRHKLKKSKYSVEEIINSAIDNVISVKKDSYIFLDVGPIGAMLEPIGTLSFDEAYDIFKEMVNIAKGRVDGILLETMTDLYELKAAILAVKENSNLPVFATMSFDETKRTLTGSTPKLVANFLSRLDVDAIGVNCSLGPVELKEIVEEMLKYSTKPVIIQPNMGLPTVHAGIAKYTLTNEEFVEAVKPYIDAGVAIIGGCCGTTPELIAHLAKEFKGKSVYKREIIENNYISSSMKIVNLNKVTVCGERLNPTGKKKLKQAIQDENYEDIVREAINEERANADILDVNVGVPKIDEPRIMCEVIKRVQAVIDLPLQIDSSNFDALEKGCRYYNGIPLINSTNGEDDVMEHVFRIAKKYGASVIGLTLDSNGIPNTSAKRMEIAKRIISKAESLGINKNRLVIDALVLTASAQQELVKETLDTVYRLTNELNISTCLGVSNVSFGLPERGILNHNFLGFALANGLKVPIINPLDKLMMDTISSYKVLYNIDLNASEYIRSHSLENSVNIVNTTDLSLPEMIKKGLKDEAVKKANELLETTSPIEIIDSLVIPALNEVGELFEKGTLFLPQLMQAAEATKQVFSILSTKFSSKESLKGPIIMATVKGDIHDIGKNIVKVVLESYGYKVIDLGSDVDKSVIVDAYYKYKPKAIGLSALMTTTVVSMEETIKELKSIENMCPIWVGGAVLTQEFADKINADYYCKDALASVNLAKKMIG